MDALVEAAARAREHACAPYSGFRVGAALEDADGRVWTGCNVENATYGLSVCAERVALLKALSEGARRFRRLAVVTAASVLTPPCGSCRQLLWEYAGDLEVILSDGDARSETLRLSQLLPRPFDATYFRP
jgi:cytidine deaminase